jgi:5-methylcytosine-specific restriction endonuclease McrA
MNAPVINAESIVSTPSAAESTYHLEQVSDSELLTNTRRLVGRSNQLLAALLAHLAEVEARGIHRLRACSSLYAYCIYELRFSEDAAYRRARAARVARRFPVIFRQVADGELHLTALVMLAPHLTEENHHELLALAKHRTKREVLRIVRTLAPEPSVPDRIEPLGRQPVGIPVPSAPSWRKLVESFASGGRELPLGDRPKDWFDAPEGVSPTLDRKDWHDCEASPPSATGSVVPDVAGDASVTDERYLIQFTASQEYTDLLERAQDLLSHTVPNRSLEEVHLRALRLLVEKLEKHKYGAPRAKPPAELSASEPTRAVAPSADLKSEATGVPPEAPLQAPQSERHAQLPRQRGESPRPVEQSKKRTRLPRQRGPASVRREVRDRDGLQCSFVDEFGTRCRETRFLELHHELPHAQGGGETVKNLTMRCQAHNALAAEHDFGRDFMLERMSRNPRRRR